MQIFFHEVSPNVYALLIYLFISGQTTVLPPIKVGSDPIKNNREKISWRTEPVNMSIGWGGGKKRTTNN